MAQMTGQGKLFELLVTPEQEKEAVKTIKKFFPSQVAKTYRDGDYFYVEVTIPNTPQSVRKMETTGKQLTSQNIVKSFGIW